MSKSLDAKINDLNDSRNRRDIRQQIKDSITQSDIDALSREVDKLPLTKVITHLQYLDNVILPAIEKKQGDDSEQYKHFKGIFDCLIWAINTHRLHDRFQYALSNEKLLCEFYREKTIFYESELMRYTTRENLLMQETFFDLREVMAQNGINNLKNLHKHQSAATVPGAATPNDDILM